MMRRFPGVLPRPALLLGLALSAMALATCKETSGPDTEFVIQPENPSLFVGETIQLTAIGAPGAVAWSSSNSQVASVIAETGFVRAHARGTATISAVSGSTVATADVTVMAPPTIALSTPSVDFAKGVGGADPPGQSVSITNSGDGNITGLALGTIAYGEGQPEGWLTAALSGSATPATVNLTARGNLPRGVYTATVPITAPNVDNSPQSLAVTFRVQTPPSIVASTQLVALAGIPGSTVADEVEITNGGDQPLTGLATAITYPVGQPSGWLVADIDDAAPTTLTVTASTVGLPVGNYAANVRVSSDITGVQPADIAVQLTVSPGPAIVLSTTTANISAATGQNPPNRTVNVTNGGGGTLGGLSVGTINYPIGTGGWLTATLDGPTAPAVLTLIVNSAALPEGAYRATVPVQSAQASNSPLTLTVNLTVGPPPVVSASPNLLVFSGWAGGPPPGLQQVLITNAGGGTLSDLTGLISYGPGATDWLTPMFVGGNTTAPTAVNIRPNTTELSPGTYEAEIEFKPAFGGARTDTVTVTYIVRAFSVDIYPGFASVPNGGQGCMNCHGAGLPPNFHGMTASNLAAFLVNSGLVVPNSPNSSSLFMKISPNHPAVIHAGGKFSAFSSLIGSWITAGAPNR